METIERAGIPVMAVQGPRGGYGIVEQFRLDRQIVTADDLFYIISSLGSISSSLTDKRITATVEKMKTLSHTSRPKGLAMPQEKLDIDFRRSGETGKQETLKIAARARGEQIIRFALRATSWIDPGTGNR
jgi:predicted DNA-binding transcriptional regulator YafY